jgi:hypothetical protein
VYDIKELSKIKKLFLTLNNTQILTYLPENKQIQCFLDEFEDMSKLDI